MRKLCLVTLWARVTARDERGTTAVQYGMLVAGIALLVLAQVQALGH